MNPLLNLPLATNLKDTHAAHIEPVAAFCLYHTNEDTVAGWTAYDCSHTVYVDSEFANSIGYATASTSCLNERHFKGEYFL